MWSGTGKEERAVAVIEEGTAATLSRSSRLVVVEHSGSVAAPLVWSLIVQLSNLIPRAQFILNLWRFCLICLTYCNKKQHLITSLRWIVLSVNFLQLLLVVAYMSFLCSAYMSFLCFFFGTFFFLGLSSWNPEEDKQKEPIWLLATAQSLRLQKCLHPHDDDDDDDEVLCCRLTNTFAVHKEPIILQQVQVFLFFSFVFSLVCNSGSCNWGLRSSSSIICMCDPGAGWSPLMLYSYHW